LTGFLVGTRRVIKATRKQLFVCELVAQAILGFPIQNTGSFPAFLELAHNLHVASTSICTGFEIAVEAVDQVAKVRSQVVAWNEVIHEIV
jgi:hypothetical protein